MPEQRVDHRVPEVEIVVGTGLAIDPLVSHSTLVKHLLRGPGLHYGPSPAGVYQTYRNLQLIHQLLPEKEADGRETVSGQIVPGGLGPGGAKVQDFLLWDLQYGLLT